MEGRRFHFLVVVYVGKRRARLPGNAGNVGCGIEENIIILDCEPQLLMVILLIIA